MSYVDLDTFKKYIGVNRSADPPDDELLQGAIDAAEVWIESMCNRRFELNVEADPATVRLFASTRSAVLPVDDFVELVSIDDDGYALDPTSYQADTAEIRRAGGWSSTCGMRTVSVTAKWGWGTIPAAVQQACLILARDILQNRQIPFGLAGVTEFAGVRARENPQVRMLLAPYDRRVLVA